jgi:hypothetical protein
VTLTADTQVTATFTLKAYPLSVSRAGNGAGTISSVPAGIDCGGVCGQVFDYGTVVTLTATPVVSSTFTGWSGGCAGLGACLVTITQPTSVTATFALKSLTVTVVLSGSGTGLVTSSPTGIACGRVCAANFSYGTVLTLTADAASGSSFVDWSAPCSGSEVCRLVVTQAMTVTVTFRHGKK